MNDYSAQDPLGFWSGQCWSQGVTPWHLNAPHGHLTEHLDLLLNGRPASQLKILVPLCGKSIDLIWLKNQGFQEVIGVEGVRLAIEAFSSEYGVPLRETIYKDTGIPSFESEDGRLKILLTNFFKLDHATLNGSIDCVWDRGSVVAILPEDRPIYATTMKRLLKGSSFRYLMNTVDYDQSLMDGPPFSVPQNSIQDNFGSFCKVENLLQATDNSQQNVKNIHKKVFPDVMNRCLYLLSPK
jgi:thiopurine S-methyltransferase